MFPPYTLTLTPVRSSPHIFFGFEKCLLLGYTILVYITAVLVSTFLQHALLINVEMNVSRYIHHSVEVIYCGNMSSMFSLLLCEAVLWAMVNDHSLFEMTD